MESRETRMSVTSANAQRKWSSACSGEIKRCESACQSRDAHGEEKEVPDSRPLMWGMRAQLRSVGGNLTHTWNHKKNAAVQRNPLRSENLHDRLRSVVRFGRGKRPKESNPEGAVSDPAFSPKPKNLKGRCENKLVVNLTWETPGVCGHGRETNGPRQENLESVVFVF